MGQLATILIFIGSLIAYSAQGAVMKEYVITETDKYTSLDPLDADLTHNLPVARMIYATPLEIDASDSMTSLVLESFSYDRGSQTITWVVKKGLKFSDATMITADDVAFSVARMIHARPKFPVIENIEGVSEWLKSSNPLSNLPSGIKIDGQKITLRLTKDSPHPLFRFCLELFSIIPKSCVDLKTSKIKCEKIPESGRYSLVENSQDFLLFKKRLSEKVPEGIKFKYVSAADMPSKLSTIANSAIIAGNESMYSVDMLKTFTKNGSLYYLPAARFAVLQIQPGHEPFSDKMCRQIFAGQFRKEYQKITGDYSPMESSIFTKLLPGYIEGRELESGLFAEFKDAELENCRAQLKQNEIQWGYVETEKNSAFVKAFESTLNSLGLKSKITLFSNRKEMSESFSKGDISFFPAGSGFWANDPVGDLKMLFTPNLHKPLNFITKDETLQKLINDLVDDQGNKSFYLAVNKYLHDEALFNVYTHVRRFYFSKNKSSLKQIPQGSAAPTPWQVFE